MGNNTSSSQPQRVASSTPSTKPPPIRKDDPLPATASIDGISVGSSQGCSKCILTVSQGISSSAAQIYRDQGTILGGYCFEFNNDVDQVLKKKMSIETLKNKLTTKGYYTTDDFKTCRRIFFKPEDLTAVTQTAHIPWGKEIKGGEVRKITYDPIALSSTKLIIKPSIPFRIYFNGEQIDVKIMTLFHPSPIRIENVQHDAVLTLGDPADLSSKVIVMVPLAGSSLPTQTSSFIEKIATYIPGALVANASTGLFDTVNVPTGNDWNLSTLLPGSPRNGENVVNVGYFSWETAPRLEPKLRNIVQAPANLPDVHHYGWKPAENSPSLRYIMLKDAVTINAFDLQTIRMLPITSPTDAIQPPLIDTLVYSPPTTCKDKPYDKSCDPFANIPVKKPIDSGVLWQTILGIIGSLAMLIGLYFAIKYASDKKWGLWLKNKITGSGTGTGTGTLKLPNFFSRKGTPATSGTGTGVLPTLLPTNPAGNFSITNPGAGTGLVVPGAGTGLIPPTTTTTTRKITPKRTTFANKGPVANPIQQALKKANKSGITMPDMRTPEQIARDLASARVKNRFTTNQVRGSRSGTSP